MKVDEQFKCKDCDNYNQCKYYHNRRETSFICKEFQNQWGLVKELENIKSEIKDEEYSTNWLVSADVEKGWNEAIEYAIRKIDKHIVKLKGE